MLLELTSKYAKVNWLVHASKIDLKNMKRYRGLFMPLKSTKKIKMAIKFKIVKFI